MFNENCSHRSESIFKHFFSSSFIVMDIDYILVRIDPKTVFFKDGLD